MSNSESLTGFTFNRVAGEPTLSCVKCQASKPYGWNVAINNRSLEEVVNIADAHATVAHEVSEAKAEAKWSDHTDAIFSDGAEALSELSEVAERALRAAAAEVLPVLTRWFTKPK